MAINIPNTANSTTSINVPFTLGATQAITVMCWVYLPTLTPVAYRDIVTVDPNIYMQIFSDGTTMDFGTANDDHTGSALRANTWYHVCQVVVPTSTTSRQIYGYINGELNVNVLDGDTSVTYTAICVGNSVFSGYAFPLNGNIQNVRVWTRQLTPSEINDEMNSKTPVHKQALYTSCTFFSGTGADESGNNRVFTIGSAVVSAPGFINPYTRDKKNF